MGKEIRISFLKRLKMSIFDFDKYHIIASEGLKRGITYLIKLIMLFAAIISIAMIIRLSQLFDQGIQYFIDNSPNFHFENNQFVLESDNDYTIENHQYLNFKIVFTNSEEYSEDEIRSFDGLVIVFTKSHILIKEENSTSIVTQTYEEIKDNVNLSNVNKDYVVNIVRGDNAYLLFVNIFIIVFVSMFFAYLLTTVLYIFALSLLGMIVSRFIRLPLKYSAILSLSISSMTLSTLLNATYLVINLFTGFVVPYFEMMYILISYVYLIAAILIMRSEIIKKKVKIQVEIMNKNFNSEDLQNKNKEDNTEDKEKDKKGNEGKEENKSKNDSGKELKKSKDNPEPQANIQENNQKL